MSKTLLLGLTIGIITLSIACIFIFPFGRLTDFTEGVPVHSRPAVRQQDSLTSTKSSSSTEGLTDAGATIDEDVPTLHDMVKITDMDFSSVPYHIPLTLVGSTTAYTASDTIQLSYSYPESLATKYKHKAIDNIDCYDLPDINKLVFTALYLLDEANGQLFFDFPSWELSTKGGVHRISLDTNEILRNGEFEYLKASTSSGQFRFVVLVRRPNLSSCNKAVGNYLSGESIDGGLMKDVATSSLFGVGYSKPFILQ